LWLVGLLLLPTVAVAQGVIIRPDVAIDTQVPMPQLPPRDSAQSPKAGTATLRGRVVAADTGQPLRKAQVRIAAPDIRENRLTSTDADGKYEFTSVVAGRYTLTASKGSFVQLQYGQQRPFEQGKPLTILDGQLVERVDFALPRGAIITGRVVDEFGEPLPDAMVSVQRYQNFNGQRRLVPAGRNGMTNDIGEFRLFAIPPGQYYLSATMRPIGMPGDSDDRSGYAPTYFPGTTNVAEAQKVTVGLGQIISDLNMALLPTRVSRITGTAVDSTGRAFTGMIMAVPRGDSMMMMFGPPAQIKPDGSFAVGGLTPGRYVLQARSAMGPMTGDAEVAYLDITVNGDDISGVRLVATRPSTVTGRVLVDPAAAAALRPSTLMLSLQSVEPDMFMFGLMPAKVADDLTFELKAAPGRARVTLNGQVAGWAIRAVRYGGVDVTDSGIEFKPSEDVADLEVELTNRLTSLSGLVSNAKGEALKDYSVIVFPSDRDKWTPNSRFLRTARPDQDGRYKINGLPPGDYRVIALDYVDPNEWNEPEFLERIRPPSSAVSLGEGEAKSLDLRLTAGER
jgi:protocatechuate 3,4-dioxygenase beta subunit